MEFVSQTNFLSFSQNVLLCENGYFKLQKIKKEQTVESIDSHFRKMTKGKLVDIY